MPEQVYRTLFIGLGGTGLRICDRIVGRFETMLLNPLVTQYMPVLAIDSLEQKEPDVKYLLPNDYFSLSGFRLASQESGQAVINNMMNLADDSGGFFNEWYGTQRSAPPDSFRTGAGQQRVNGRVLLHANLRYEQGADGLKSRLSQAVNRTRIRNADVGNVEFKQNSTSVVIFTGAAGGTGSGMLLDVAALVRSIFDANPNVNLRSITAVVLTDSVLLRDRNKRPEDFEPEWMRQNTESCLSEIDFWSQPAVLNNTGINYKARWSPADPAVQAMPAGEAIIHKCYIVENATSEGVGPDTAEGVYGLVADLFADLYSDARMLGKYDAKLNNLDAGLDLWGSKHPSAPESIRFGRLGRVKVYVPIDHILRYLKMMMLEEAIEKGFEHRHSKPEDQNRFVQDEVACFVEQHVSPAATRNLLQYRGRSYDGPAQPNFDRASNMNELMKMARSQLRVPPLETRVDVVLDDLKPALFNDWLYRFADYQSAARDRISAQNIVFFLREIEMAVKDAMREVQTQMGQEPELPDLKKYRSVWTKSFKFWQLTALQKGRVAKGQAERLVGNYQSSWYAYQQNQARLAYLDRLQTLIANLLTTANAIVGALCDDGGVKTACSRLRSQVVNEMRQMADEQLNRCLIRAIEQLAALIPDWMDTEKRKPKLKALYQRWISGDYHAGRSEDGEAVSYWEGSHPGMLNIMHAMLTDHEPDDLLDQSAHVQLSPAMIAKRESIITQYQQQIEQSMDAILNDAFSFNELGQSLNVWKVMLHFDETFENKNQLATAVQKRWKAWVMDRAKSLSAYALDRNATSDNLVPKAQVMAVFDEQSARQSAYEALQPYDVQRQFNEENALPFLLGTADPGVGVDSTRKSPYEISILRLESQCKLRHFTNIGDAFLGLNDGTIRSDYWLDVRMPTMIAERDKGIPPSDADRQRLLLSVGLAWAWRNQVGLDWNRDKPNTGGMDVFTIESQRFEDISGLFEELPQSTAWKTVQKKLKQHWKNLGLADRRRALDQARQDLLKLAKAKRDTSQYARKAVLNETSETLRSLLDNDDAFLQTFDL